MKKQSLTSPLRTNNLMGDFNMIFNKIFKPLLLLVFMLMSLTSAIAGNDATKATDNLPNYCLSTDKAYSAKDCSCRDDSPKKESLTCFSETVDSSMKSVFEPFVKTIFYSVEVPYYQTKVDSQEGVVQKITGQTTASNKNPVTVEIFNKKGDKIEKIQIFPKDGKFVVKPEKSIDINTHTISANANPKFPLIAAWLLIAALIFTFYFGFIQFRKVGLSIDIIRGKYTDPNKKEAGEVSHFQALATALSGTVGLGNIAGVGAALAIGGPGATFWMILIGLLGMAAKFVECTLGVKYRTILPSGAVSGGPMYYLSRGMEERGMGGLGKVLAVGFAFMCILGSFGGGNMFQSNQAFIALNGVNIAPDGSGPIVGVILAVLVAVVIMGGVTRIANVTDKVVPMMAVLYVVMSLIVIIANFSHVGDAFAAIFSGAFTGEGVVGGFIGALIQGLKRATFSNEAGVGSAAIAHSAVKTDEPASEGLVALLEPFIDTVIICTMTALVITISGLNSMENMAAVASGADNALTGVTLTQAAFTNTSSFFAYPLAIAIVLFAFSTMISWSYYGLKAWTYLFGENAIIANIYKAIFCIFIVIGASIKFGFVIAFSDAAIFAMSIFNIIGLYFLMPVVKKEIDSYIARVKSGEIKKFK